jgi:xanthine dehydrogenase accessory factor
VPGWASQLAQVLETRHCVMVTLNLIVGSAPREAGSRMIVTATGTLGSIGGGQLEFEATMFAQKWIADGRTPRQEHQAYALGPALNQCCGGTVTLLFERFPPGSPSWLNQLLEMERDRQMVVLASAIDRSEPFKTLIEPDGIKGSESFVPHVIRERGTKLLQEAGESGVDTVETPDESWWLECLGVPNRRLFLFGAGHVGQAVARQLSGLPFEVTWIDGRPDTFPARTGPNIVTVQSDDAPAEAGKAPPGSLFVVMTHSHQLDEDICFEVLSREDFSWLGLIGSVTKRRRFILRLAQRGIDDETLARLVCPIGLSGIKGKQPATIALSLAAQLMHDPESETANE